jgi:adenylate kinase family enzyme
MLEVIEHYEHAGIVSRIDGRGAIDEVTARILDALGLGERVG